MEKKTTPKVSIVIPLYKPEKIVFNRVKEMLRKQTIKAEVIEMWNNPEVVSMNRGIKKAKGELVVILNQDCVPENKFWLEKLIQPFKNKDVVATDSDAYFPEWYWKKYPFLTRILAMNEITMNEKVKKHPRDQDVDMRTCAFRKEDLKKIKLLDENPEIVDGTYNFLCDLKKLGKIVHSDCKVYHLHYLDNFKKRKQDYRYSFCSGQYIRAYGSNMKNWWKKILRGIPFFGILPVFDVFPFRKYPHLFPIYFLLFSIQHVIWVYGFWVGFFSKEGLNLRRQTMGKMY